MFDYQAPPPPPLKYHHPTTSREILMDELSYPRQHDGPMEMELDHLLRFRTSTNCLMHDSNEPKWEPSSAADHFTFNSPDQSPTTPDLLNLFNMPRGPASASASTDLQGFLGDLPMEADDGSTLYDQSYYSNLPPLLLHSLPHGYTLPESANDDGVLELTKTKEMVVGGDIDGGGGKRISSKNRVGKIKPTTTERQRRVQLNTKFNALKSLIPNPTKPDKASIVEDAIGYIKELLRTVSELKVLVEKKKRSKKRKTRDEDDVIGEVESSGNMMGHGKGSSLMRSSWLQRKSKDTEVDVRIVDDEVTIKLVQRNKINCLLYVSKVLDELQLDLHHVAGGHIGDFNSFLFNTKIHEGSSVYASAIANKVIEVMDREFAAIPPNYL